MNIRNYTLLYLMFMYFVDSSPLNTNIDIKRIYSVNINQFSNILM